MPALESLVALWRAPRTLEHVGITNDLFDKPWVGWPMKWPDDYTTYKERATRVHPYDNVPLTGLLRTYLQYTVLLPDFEDIKPYVTRVPPSDPSAPQMTFTGETCPVTIADIKGREDSFTLDKDGFQFVANAFQGTRTVENTESSVRAYMATMTKWLRVHLRAKKVVVFDFAFRSELNVSGYGEVSRRVHCDQTPRSAIGRIKLHMGDEADELLKERCRLINLWRPINPIVETYPLGVCSFTSVKPADLMPIDVVFPMYAEEAYECRPSDDQRWYYRSGMTNNDVMLLKVYDNKEAAPHSGFNDPTTRSDAPARSSIELRCLVFGEDET